MEFHDYYRQQPFDKDQWTDEKLQKSKKDHRSKPKITTFRLFRTSLLYQTREFFNNSTLHGVRYIAETGRPFGERFMWFCFTTTGLISALVIIVSLWEKFQTNPTITGLDMDVHNQHLVFPTVVVCPLEPYDSNRTYELAYTYLGEYEEEAVNIFGPFLKYLPQLTYENMEAAFEESKNITSNEAYKRAINKKSLRSLAFQSNIFCNDTFDTCKYRDEEIKCCEHFYPIYSEHGFCYAFNPRYIDAYDSETKNEYYHDLFETDKKWALSFTPKRESKIFVHSHFENFGLDFRPHIIWEPDFAAELLISMKQTYTTDDARQLSIGQRKCIFADEVKLDIYDEEYTFTSCMKECRLKKSMKLCHCIAPFYRNIASMPYCKMNELECLVKYAANIAEVRDCHKCELSCTNTVYDIEKLSKTIADPSKPLETFVNIEYLTWPIIRYKREVLFGWVDLLVSFGGIAGLFLGFSLLSGVEIIYYFTLRACCMLYKNRSELYEIEEKKLLKPLKFINLSLKSIKTNKDMDPNDGVRQITVAEAKTSKISKGQQLNDENSVLDENNRYNFLMPKRMNRVSMKINAINTLRRPNKIATSYDYAQSTRPMYMP